MNLLEYIREALGALVKNKLRSILSLLGIVIGISSVVVLTAIGDGFKEQMMKSFSSTNTMITIARGSTRYGPMDTKNIKQAFTNATVDAQANRIFTPKMIDELRVAMGEHATYILPKVQSPSGNISRNGRSIPASITAIEPEYLNARKIQLNRGMSFSSGQIQGNEKVALVGEGIIKEFKGEDPLGQSFMIGNHLFHIIGTLKKTDDWSTDNTIFIPVSTARERMGASKIENIQVYVDDMTTIPTVSANLGYYLMKQVGSQDPKNSGFHLETNEQFLKEMQKNIGSATLMISGIAAISLIVGGIGIMNIMLVSVTERTREIGIRKAIGARRRDIVIQFLTEAAVLSLIGGILAILFSYLVAFGIAKFVPSLAPVITLQTILIATGFSILMGIVFWLMPAWKAAKMEPIDALRFE